MNEILIYERRRLKGESFDDEKVKDAVIERGRELFGFEVKRNDRNNKESTYGIDLIAVHDSSIGVEVERSNAVHDHWTDTGFAFKSKYDFETINMPDRKVHLWKEFYQRWDKENHCFLDKELILNPGFGRNIFTRTNWSFTQFIVVDAYVISDDIKTLRKRFKASNNSATEGWLCWKKEFTTTFNLIDGKIVRETNDLITHLPLISNDEKKQLEDMRDIEKYGFVRNIGEDKRNLRLQELYRETHKKN